MPLLPWPTIELSRTISHLAGVFSFLFFLPFPSVPSLREPSKLHNNFCQASLSFHFRVSSTSFRFSLLLDQALDLLVPVSSNCLPAPTVSSLPPPAYLLVVFKGSYFFRMGYLVLREASRLDAFSVYPFQTWLLCYAFGTQQMHQRSVHSGPLVLRTAPLKYPTPTTDRDRTVSRRSEPSSRTALMGEQPNPWDLLQPQDAMSRHRGAKPPRRCELLGEISLLSPG